MNFLYRCEVKVCHVVGWSAILWMIKEPVKIHSLQGLHGWQPRMGKYSSDLVKYTATFTIIFSDKSSTKCAFLMLMTSLDNAKFSLSTYLSLMIHFVRTQDTQDDTFPHFYKATLAAWCIFWKEITFIYDKVKYQVKSGQVKRDHPSKNEQGVLYVWTFFERWLHVETASTLFNVICSGNSETKIYPIP